MKPEEPSVWTHSSARVNNDTGVRDGAQVIQLTSFSLHFLEAKIPEGHQAPSTKASSSWVLQATPGPLGAGLPGLLPSLASCPPPTWRVLQLWNSGWQMSGKEHQGTKQVEIMDTKRLQGGILQDREETWVQGSCVKLQADWLNCSFRGNWRENSWHSHNKHWAPRELQSTPGRQRPGRVKPGTKQGNKGFPEGLLVGTKAKSNSQESQQVILAKQNKAPKSHYYKYSYTTEMYLLISLYCLYFNFRNVQILQPPSLRPHLPLQP